MHDTAYRRQPFQPGGDEIVDFFLVSDVAPADNNLRADSRQLIHKLLYLSGYGATAGDEDNVSRTLSNHPSRHTAPQTASAANQDVGSIWMQQLAGLLGRCGL
jgi:hypothetical protein